MNFNIHFARPDVLWKVVPYIVVATMILLYRLYKTNLVVHLLAGPNQIKKVLQHYSFTRSIVKIILFLTGMFFLAIALMRPQWNETEHAVTQKGRDLLIALDISRSMLAQDLEPDRLSFAKNKIQQLLKTLPTERVGLLLFSGSTFLQCPLTDDKAAFNMFLDSIDVETISSGTTSIEQAIKEAILLFKKMPERKNKLLLIFTDGEDFSSNLTQVKKEAAKIGLHIITVGVGTPEGAPIPLYDRRSKQTGHQHDAQGNVVISRMNEGILLRLAEDTGGMFVPITKNSDDIKKIKQFVRSFEKEHLEDKMVTQFQEQYHYPLLISFICFAIEWLL
jgi:Ca-activated chloride channel family protein